MTPVGAQVRLGAETRTKWITLGAVLLGNFSGGIVFTLLSVARQTIGAELGTKPSLVTWAFTGPSLVAAVVAPALGRFGDLRGHKRMLLFALLGGVVTAVLVASSRTIGQLIAFRSLSAIAGAALGPSSLALIFRAFEREDRVKAMGYWALVNAGSPVIGVLVGGPIVDHFGWRWMFVGQVPLFAIAAAVSWRTLSETPKRAVSRFDSKGAATLGAATLALLLSVNRGPVWGWTDVRIVVGFVAVPLLFWLFTAIEKHVSEPLLPLAVLRSRNVVAGGGAQALLNFSYLGGSLFLANDLLVDKRYFGFALSQASRYTIARPIAFSIVAPLAGYLAVRVGERTTATFGCALTFFAMLGFSIISPGKSLWFFVAFIALSGLGQGVCNPSLASTVANAVPETILGAVGAAQQLVVQMGGVIGTQVLATIAGGDARTDVGYHVAFSVAAVVAATAVLCARMIRPMTRAV